jgi:hypothetical protein
LKNREEFLRDLSIQGQMLDFISLFSDVNDDNIQEYMINSRMSESDFISYLTTVKDDMSKKSDNKIYGYLVTDYVNIVDKIINKIK